MSNSTTSNIKKGTFGRWSGTSAQWYEAASAYTGYHDKLVEYISRYITESDKCAELACGAGTLARHIAPLVKSYAANDIDTGSIDFCTDMQEADPIEGLSYELGDWRNVFNGRSFDVVFFSFFSAVLNDWDDLKKIAAKKVIAITPRYTEEEKAAKRKAVEQHKSDSHAGSLDRAGSHGDADSHDGVDSRDSAGSRTDAVTTMPGNIRKKDRSFETIETISAFLEKRGIPYESIALSLEFGQPCSTLEEAMEYTRYYYKFETDEECHQFIDEKFKPADCGYFYSKKKNINITVIDMTKA